MNIPLNIDFQQILLHLFNFVILAGGLYLLLYKPVKEFMEKRTSYYAGLDAEANEKLKHAQKMEETCQQRLSKIEEEAGQKRIEATRMADKEAEETVKNAKLQAEKILSEAKENAQREHQKIVASAEKEVAGLAAMAAEKLVQESLEDTYEQFFEAAKRG